MLSGKDLTIRIGGKVLVENVSIDVRPGEVVAVLGANGAGKSTLLKTLSGQITPWAGTVRINGRVLGELGSEMAARSRAVLAQDSTLSADFTALEVALLGRTPYQLTHPSERDRRIAAAALAAADVGHLSARSYTTLSGGERQRVHLARVLAQVWETEAEPRYLLLDEPTSSLDIAHQQIALRAARDFTRRGGGALAILHDPNLAAGYADRIVLMRNGRIVDQGEPSAVITPENIRITFDVMAVVLPHPLLDIPLVVPIAQGDGGEHARQAAAHSAADPTHGVARIGSGAQRARGAYHEIGKPA